MGRADLLRVAVLYHGNAPDWWACAGAGGALDSAAGFQRKPDLAPETAKQTGEQSDESTQGNAPDTPTLPSQKRARRQMPWVWVADAGEPAPTKPTAEGAGTQADTALSVRASFELPTPEVAQQDADALLCGGAQGVARQARASLARAVQRSAMPGRTMDWPGVVRRAAQLQSIWPLPRRCRTSLAELVVALDMGAASCAPVVWDMAALATGLRRWLGHRAVSLRLLATDPSRAWQPWDGSGKPGSGPVPWRDPWPGLYGGWLVVVSDFGLGRSGHGPTADGKRQQAFANWLQTQRRKGARLFLLAPVLPAQAAALPAPGPLGQAALWRGADRAQPVGAALAPSNGPVADQRADPPALAQLLGLVAWLAPRGVHEALLRALRLRLPDAGGHAVALDWAAWNHEDMEPAGPRYRRVRPDRWQACLQAAATLPAAVLTAALQDARRLKSGLPLTDQHLLTLQAEAALHQMPASVAVGTLKTQLQPPADAACDYLAQTLPAAMTAGQGAGTARVAAQSLLAQAGRAVLAHRPVIWARLHQQAFAPALLRGEPVPVYAELGPPVLRSVDEPGASAVNVQLVQRGAGLWLLPASADDKAVQHGVVLTPPLGVLPVGARIALDLAGQRTEYEVSSVPHWLGQLPLDNTQRVCLHLPTRQVPLNQVQRPSWAIAWQHNRNGVSAEVPLPWRDSVALELSGNGAWSNIASGSVGAMAWACGVDEVGLYLDLTMQGFPQRLRYIAPGTFQMGSTKGKVDIGPVHRVTLSQGYWLGDTPCTQGFWKVIMGSNPSRFQDGPVAQSRPVDSVSWDDICGEDGQGGFLRKLKAHLPLGSEVALPSEAQWEYAARAGSQWAYWWGDDPRPDMANWNKVQAGTTPVKQYPANAWGLYDVHGNVLEWCADGIRRYKNRAERDPVGPVQGQARVLRGGSWGSSPGRARAAHRDSSNRGGIWSTRGFRILLRSSIGSGWPGPTDFAGWKVQPNSAVEAASTDAPIEHESREA